MPIGTIITTMNAPELTGRRANDTLLQLRRRLEESLASEVDRFPAERDLAQELRVSRRTVRQALAVLEAEGHIQRTRGRGTLILQPGALQTPPEGDLKPYTSPAELMQTRLVLEPAIAALAATHASSQDIEDMQDLLKKGRASHDARAWERWDGALHRAIGRATGNALLICFSDMVNAARDQTAWGQLRRVSLTRKRQALYVSQHEAILAAIADRRADGAARAMRRHLLTVKTTLLDQHDDLGGLDDLGT